MGNIQSYFASGVEERESVGPFWPSEWSSISEQHQEMSAAMSQIFHTPVFSSNYDFRGTHSIKQQGGAFLHPSRGIVQSDAQAPCCAHLFEADLCHPHPG